MHRWIDIRSLGIESGMPVVMLSYSMFVMEVLSVVLRARAPTYRHGEISGLVLSMLR